MKRKDGEPRSDYDAELDVIILNLIKEKLYITAENIRQQINKAHGRRLGWITIKRHLDRLLDNKKVKIIYETYEGKIKIRLYSIV